MAKKDDQASPKPISIIGLGNMGEALLGGLSRSSEFNTSSIHVFDQHQDRRQSLAKFHSCKEIQDISELKTLGGVIILCVKPHDLGALASALRGKLDKVEMIVSILAGSTISHIKTELAYEGGVVRAMPNIAATIGEAATAMASNEVCSKSNKFLVEAIFKGVGEAYWVKEDLMDTVTGLSGSGPAYIYMVIEALTEGGVKMGLPRELSRNLATQTVLGAASLVKQTGQHPAILRDQVTTPAGTTISALHELEERGLRSMFVSAVETATERSRSIGK